MEIKMVAPSELKPHPQNPRVHPDSALEKLTRSIQEYGWTNPILVSADGIVLAGHARLKAAQQAGIKEVPVIYLPLEGAKADAYMIADNKLQDETGWDFPVLKDLLDSLEAAAVDLEITGFDLKEIEELMASFHVPQDGLTEDDAIPEQVETICKRGDLWQLGDHRLLCGDATVIADVERLMAGEKADMVFTDPPYDMDTNGGGILKSSKAMKGIRESHIDTFNPTVLNPMAAIAVYCCNKPLIPQYISLADKWNMAWDLAVYHKQNVTPNYGGHLMTDVEYLMLIGRQAPYSGQDKELYSKVFTGGKDADNKLAWSKPVALISKFINLFSLTRQLVSDPFGGSGSTLIACEKLGRRCYMMEISEMYCSVIIKRWEAYTGKQAVLVSGATDA